MKLIRANAWLALVYGVLSLIMAPQIVDLALTSLGVKEDRIMQNEAYLIASSFVRIAGLFLLVYALILRYVIKKGLNADEPKPLFTVFAIGLLLWSGLLLFLISTKCPVLGLAAALGLLEWLLLPLFFLFTYKKVNDWKAIRPLE